MRILVLVCLVVLASCATTRGGSGNVVTFASTIPEPETLRVSKVISRASSFAVGARDADYEAYYSIAPEFLTQPKAPNVSVWYFVANERVAELLKNSEGENETDVLFKALPALSTGESDNAPTAEYSSDGEPPVTAPALDREAQYATLHNELYGLVQGQTFELEKTYPVKVLVDLPSASAAVLVDGELTVRHDDSGKALLVEVTAAVESRYPGLGQAWVYVDNLLITNSDLYLHEFRGQQLIVPEVQDGVEPVYIKTVIGHR